ncbi:unnamed protein product [Periconia digitata]|uniref:Uncharacterized protein n=1 Tax=Periconia digitata TaxID=1303443 RepID=A0A9W4UE59_9PLEO|nr:unnamed protein product [Periconia digitata]
MPDGKPHGSHQLISALVRSKLQFGFILRAPRVVGTLIILEMLETGIRHGILVKLQLIW